VCVGDGWLQPAAEIRRAVRSEKGLPVIINILSPSHLTLDVIARTAAICLRNLAVDSKNKELIGNEIFFLPMPSAIYMRYFGRTVALEVFATIPVL